MKNYTEDVSAIPKQEQTCNHCNYNGKIDTILDLATSKSYFICPECGAGNKIGQ